MTKNNDKLIIRSFYVISAFVLIFLFWFIYFKQTGQATSPLIPLLPHVNAALNSLTSVLLIIGIIFIKKGNEKAHIITMLSAVATSVLFLVSYLLYHHFHGDTKFIAQGLIRPVYFFILISHIVLSAVNLPMILITLLHAFRKNWEKHKKLAKITFPIWLYVSVTGVLIYIFVQKLNH